MACLGPLDGRGRPGCLAVSGPSGRESPTQRLP
ncbi:hypothetical protein CABS03_08464 [Colletotrichum abscissum]|uniref:Uncharacterized protein n=2 Tax=Colletotrichum acutatum species complex TaxID=2707335 RepID=A0A9P9XRE0_9PEZI|nr:hypothetical protein CABS02_01193 [Colletotrichum abscissum]KAK0380577.1 hypothetical protein CLIM01_02044 [Colletotrichum limetticola]